MPATSPAGVCSMERTGQQAEPIDGRRQRSPRPKRPGHRALRTGRIALAEQTYLITTTTCERQRFFEDFDVACASARCFDDQRLLAGARMLTWVLMPDHVHWLLQLGPIAELSGQVNRLKPASSRAANKALGREGGIWARAFHDHALRRDEDLTVCARYIVANPVRAGLVRSVRAYPFWNAIWM